MEEWYTPTANLDEMWKAQAKAMPYVLAVSLTLIGLLWWFSP